MRADRAPTPVPFAKIGLLGSILLANNTSIWMIFSFLPFMVSHFYPELPTTELGFQAGILGSAFSCGGLIGNFVSGVISDKVGRRPALMWGLLGTAVSSLCFGFSPTFWFAVASRFLWGILNGNIGVAKTYLSEISDDSNLARGMSYFGVIGSVGRVVGPIIGGLLSYPADSMPQIFGGTVFATYPFALPSAVVSVNCIIMYIVAYYWLPETLQSRLLEQAASRRSMSGSGGGSHGGVQYSALETTDPGSPPDTIDNDTEIGAQEDRFATESVVDGNGSIELQKLTNGKDHNIVGNQQQHKPADPAEEASNPLLSGLDTDNIATLEEGGINVTTSNRSKTGTMQSEVPFVPLAVNGRGRLSGETDTESVITVESLASNNSSKARADQSSSPLHRSPARPPRRSITFSSVVKVKTIDQPRISFQGLKQVAPDEAPIIIEHEMLSPLRSAATVDSQLVAGPLNARIPDMSSPVGLQQQLEGQEESELEESLLPTSVRYSNGAEYFESVDSSKKTLSANLAYLFKQRQVFISTTLYGFGSFIVIIGNEVFTLWVVTSWKDGGLNYNTQQIGTAIMFCGVIGTFLQLFLYPYAVDKLGVLKVHRWGAVLLALSSVLIPTLPRLAGPSAPLTILMITVALLTLQALAATWYLVSTFVLISNSCYSHQLATVNGIGQTCASIGRLSGPYIGSVVFAWSETNGMSWPFNRYFVFYMLALLAMLSYQYSALLPRSIQRRKREPKFRNWDDADAFYRQQEALRLEEEAARASVSQDRQDQHLSEDRREHAGAVNV